MAEPYDPMEGIADLDAAVGSVAHEAARLLGVLRAHIDATDTDAAPEAGPTDTAAGPTDLGASEPGSADRCSRCGAPCPRCADPQSEPSSETECTWCPLCRTVTWARSLRPETLERLAGLATLAAATIVDLAAQARRPSRSATARAGPEGASDSPPRAHAIPVVDDPEESP